MEASAPTTNCFGLIFEASEVLVIKGADEVAAGSFNLGGVEVAEPEPEPEEAPDGGRVRAARAALAALQAGVAHARQRGARGDTRPITSQHDVAVPCNEPLLLWPEARWRCSPTLMFA